MKNEKLVTIILSALVVLMVIFVILQNTVGLDKLFGKNGASTSMPRRGGANGNSQINVEVRRAELTTFTKTINVNGELAYKNSARNVIADVSGKITEVLVNRGDYVKVGQVVAKADPSTPGAEYKIKDIVSTVSGTVVSVESYKGQTVSANTTVITIANPGELVLKLNVPEKYLSSFEAGSKASFATAAYPDYTYTGKVFFIDNVVNSNTRTVQVEVEIENPDERLMAGMFVRSRLVIEEKNDVFTVPTEALSTYLNNQTVYIVRNGKAERVNVSTGSFNDSVTIITSGLNAGDLVVVLGQVTEGTSVNIINAEELGIEMRSPSLEKGRTPEGSDTPFGEDSHSGKSSLSGKNAPSGSDVPSK